MFCINCFYSPTKVTNSRSKKKDPLVWRRRYCPKCQTIFTTHELPSLRDNAKVHYPKGKTTPFSLSKLAVSIAKSFVHSEEKAQYDSLPLAQTVSSIVSTQVKIITPEEIAAITHATLKRFDELAALQYAAMHHLVTSTRKRGRPSTAWHERPSGMSPSR